MRLILASQSPRRIELMRMLDIPFEIVVPNCDETCRGSAAEMARELALRKAFCVSRAMSGSFTVVGADTLVERDGAVFGKPRSAAHAREMLRALLGGWHSVHTGVAVVANGREPLLAVETARVHFIELSDAMIERYVKSGESMDKAGAYGIQGRAAAMIDRIEGDYYAIVGLPLCRLARMLAEVGEESECTP